MRTCMIILLVAFIGACTVAATTDNTLSQTLAQKGIQKPTARVEDDGIHVTFEADVKNMEGQKLMNQVLTVFTQVKANHPSNRNATILIRFSDGQLMEVSGDPSDFSERMSESEFIGKANFMFLTRGPPNTPGPCLTEEGMNCLKNQDECPCEPGEACDLNESKADKWGCAMGYTPKNVHLMGSEYVCNQGYEWGTGGLDCKPTPSCGEGAFGFQGKCVCKEGYQDAAQGTCTKITGETQIPKLTTIALILGVLSTGGLAALLAVALAAIAAAVILKRGRGEKTPPKKSQPV